MKLSVRSLFLLSIVALNANFLIGMNREKGDATAKSASPNSVKDVQHKGSLNSWANVIKACPSVAAAAPSAKSSTSNSQQVSSIKKNPDDSILLWLNGSTKKLPKRIIGNSFSIFFDESQAKSCKIDKSKPVLVFSWQELRHTLSPWFVDGKSFVDGGHFAKYFRKYSDNGYFFNTKTATCIGNAIIPFSRHQQHPNCEIVLWVTKDSYKKEWYPIAIKTVFDESVTLFDVLYAAANSPINTCDEYDSSYSFVIDTQNLPCFKINTRLDEYTGFYNIISIYPWGNNFESLTDNMDQYFYNQFVEPSDSILYEMSLQK